MNSVAPEGQTTQVAQCKSWPKFGRCLVLCSPVMPKLRVAVGCRFQFSDYMNNSLVILSGCSDYFFFLS